MVKQSTLDRRNNDRLVRTKLIAERIANGEYFTKIAKLLNEKAETDPVYAYPERRTDSKPHPERRWNKYKVRKQYDKYKHLLGKPVVIEKHTSVQQELALTSTIAKPITPTSTDKVKKNAWYETENYKKFAEAKDEYRSIIMDDDVTSMFVQEARWDELATWANSNQKLMEFRYYNVGQRVIRIPYTRVAIKDLVNRVSRGRSKKNTAPTAITQAATQAVPQEVPASNEKQNVEQDGKLVGSFIELPNGNVKIKVTYIGPNFSGLSDKFIRKAEAMVGNLIWLYD